MRHCLIIFVLALVSCDQTDGSKKHQRDGEPTVYYRDTTDKEMNAAIVTARQTYRNFVTSFENPKSNQTGFSIKLAYKIPTGNEHIWLSNIFKKDLKYYGVINNEPDKLDYISLGDTLPIDTTRLSDWFYIQDSKLVGGYTIRVLRNKMTDEEKASFDKEFGVLIE